MSSSHAFEMRFTKKGISLKNPIKFIQIFYEYAPTLPYYTCVKFEYILLVSLNNIFCFLEYNLYLVYVSR